MTSDNNRSGHGLLAIELGLWSREAVCCQLCGLEWTPESMAAKDARVTCVEPRRLSCAECLIRYGANALRKKLGYDKSQVPRRDAE